MKKEKLILCYYAQKYKLEIVTLLKQLMALENGDSLASYIQIEDLEWHNQVLRHIDLCFSNGAHLCHIGEDIYPKQFYYIEDPPYVFSYRGSPIWLSASTLAVVGSREPRVHTQQWMEQFFNEFVRDVRPVIVSGGANGVDQKAHQIALRNFVPTIAFLPSGLGAIYPSSFQRWIEPILEGGGAIISEYFFDQEIRRFYFEQRNRLISGISNLTLLVEARLRSGTTITARQTIQQGKALLVVPGHPLDSQFSGSLKLLSEGAVLTRNADDLRLYYESEVKRSQIMNLYIDN